jgi:hypothetical protein
MDHVLTEHGLRLTYLCDPKAIDGIDQDRMLDDLTDETPDGDPFPWLSDHRLADCDHVVLVTSRSTGRYLAFLTANDGATTQEDFLLLQTAFVTASARGQNLMRRMIALAMLRISGASAAPPIIVACTRSPLCYRIMRNTARWFRDSAFFPDLDSATINLNAVALARRIAREIGPNHRFQPATGTIRGGTRILMHVDHRRAFSNDPQIERLFGQQMHPADRMVTVLDLRGKDECEIIDEARRLYRSR